MPKDKTIWEDAPAENDYPNAHNFLSLVFEDRLAAGLVKKLRHAKTVTRQAKDVLRASELPLLAKDNHHVAADLKRIGKEKKLSPVLLVRGDAALGVPMVIADGYHRICASYYWDEDCPIAVRIVSRPKH
jgi:hypothetical protein